MSLALAVASTSPDPSTQNGAVLFDERCGLTVFETNACNQFPRGVTYTDERWERPLKYSVIEHAERNVIYEAARRGIVTEGKTLVAVWAACADCARAIIQAGITHVVTLEAGESDRWGGSIDIGMVMLEEAGVTVTYLPAADYAADGPTLRRDGKPWPSC